MTHLFKTGLQRDMRPTSHEARAWGSVVQLTFLFSSEVLRALTPSGHNDPVCWDVDNCDKKTRDVFFTSLLHEIELVNIMSDD